MSDLLYPGFMMIKKDLIGNARSLQCIYIYMYICIFALWDSRREIYIFLSIGFPKTSESPSLKRDIFSEGL